MKRVRQAYLWKCGVAELIDSLLNYVILSPLIGSCVEAAFVRSLLKRFNAATISGYGRMHKQFRFTISSLYFFHRLLLSS